MSDQTAAVIVAALLGFSLGNFVSTFIWMWRRG
jgi:hypothetical protein